MKTFTLIVKGRSSFDIKLGIAEALARIIKGNTSGQDKNEDGSFSFESEGQYEKEDEDDEDEED